MAYLTKEQYNFRREAAAKRNKENEEKAIDNGMTSEQAETISELCSLRHKFHCSIEKITEFGDDDIFKDFVSLEERMAECGLPELGVVNILEDIDDLDGLMYYYGSDVPEDRDSEEFSTWYDGEYSRIYDELSAVNTRIENYLTAIDAEFKTSFCPRGALRIY